MCYGSVWLLCMRCVLLVFFGVFWGVFWGCFGGVLVVFGVCVGGVWIGVGACGLRVEFAVVCVVVDLLGFLCGLDSPSGWVATIASSDLSTLQHCCMHSMCPTHLSSHSRVLTYLFTC